MPLFYVYCAIRKHGIVKSLPFLRRFHLVQFTLMSFAYIFYLLFPISISSIAQGKPNAGDSTILKYNFNFISNGMSKYCASPSMHVSHTLSMSFIHTTDELPFSKITRSLAYATFFSTVFTKAHYVFDGKFCFLYLEPYYYLFSKIPKQLLTRASFLSSFRFNNSAMRNTFSFIN